MKKFLFLLVCSPLLFAQQNLWSLEANYPILIDQNFVGRNFNGIVDIGLKYTLHEDLNYRFGVSLHNSLFKDKTDIQDVITDFNVLLWMVQPRVTLDLVFDSLPNIHPFFGMGYSFLTSFTNGNVATFFPEGGDTRSGYNANLGVSLDVSDQWYVSGSYDFFRLNKSGEVSNLFLQNINMIKLGVGYRF